MQYVYVLFFVARAVITTILVGRLILTPGFGLGFSLGFSSGFGLQNNTHIDV